MAKSYGSYGSGPATLVRMMWTVGDGAAAGLHVPGGGDRGLASHHPAHGGGQAPRGSGAHRPLHLQISTRHTERKVTLPQLLSTEGLSNPIHFNANADSALTWV